MISALFFSKSLAKKTAYNVLLIGSRFGGRDLH